jgi:hypothetical protein
LRRDIGNRGDGGKEHRQGANKLSFMVDPKRLTGEA